MTSKTSESVYYENSRGIRVTDRFLSTRYKDEALAPIQSVQIGREPLLIGLVVGLGLAAFSQSFADLLYDHEQKWLVGIGIAVIFLGYAVTPLRIGQYMHERTVFWSSLWTANAVRRAIAKAKRVPEHGGYPVDLRDGE